jgi:hypothetical protein
VSHCRCRWLLLRLITHIETQTLGRDPLDERSARRRGLLPRQEAKNTRDKYPCSPGLFFLVHFTYLFRCLYNTQHKLPCPRRDFFCSFLVLSLYCFVLIVLALLFVPIIQDTQHKHPCVRRDSNPQSQQSSGRRPTS